MENKRKYISFFNCMYFITKCIWDVNKGLIGSHCYLKCAGKGEVHSIKNSVIGVSSQVMCCHSWSTPNNANICMWEKCSEETRHIC